MFEVVKRIRDCSKFWEFLKIGQQPTKLATVKFFVEEPFFKASWKTIALTLYQTHEDTAIDALFQFMKSPAG